MKDIIEFKDYATKYKNLDLEDWITIYCNEKKEFNRYYDDIFEYSALVENDEKYICGYLESDNWEFGVDSFGKSYFGKIFYGNNSEIYFKDGLTEDKFEYLVACRYFNEKYEPSIEINPKLIWYYNLVKVGNNYVDPITDEVKIKIDSKKIMVLKTYLKDFLSAQNKKCIICFDNRRFYKTESKLEYYSIDNKDEYMNFTIDINSYKYNEYNGISRILGKVIINPYKNPRHKDYRRYTEEKKYEDFIIGENSSTGEEIVFTCNEDKLANYFGSNPKAPHFLTPVFFERKVLDKYTNDPSNYKVGDGTIFFLNEWSIPFTINNDDKVTVWLGDLGRIPYEEQKYWRLYNNIPQGGIEKKFVARQLEAQFTDAITHEKKLFELISEINKIFLRKYNEKIINDLSNADLQIKSAFTIPTNGSTTVYQNFLMQLCKITVESINTKLIGRVIKREMLLDENGKKYSSIKQLDIFLNHEGYKNGKKLCNVLRLAYNSRNKMAGHRGSYVEYNKLWNREKNYKPNLKSDAKLLLLQINNCLNDIVGEESDEQIK